MKRRRALGVAAGAMAAAAGVGVAFRASRVPQPSTDLWVLRFKRPGGGELAFSTLRGKPLLLNFWATWCPPCVVEMPLLASFHAQRQAAGWQVVGLAIDQESPVQQFVQERAIGFPIALAGSEGLQLSRLLGNTSGGLPFSIVFDADGRARASKLGALDAKTLSDWGSKAA